MAFKRNDLSQSPQSLGMQPSDLAAPYAGITASVDTWSQDFQRESLISGKKKFNYFWAIN